MITESKSLRRRDRRRPSAWLVGVLILGICTGWGCADRSSSGDDSAEATQEVQKSDRSSDKPETRLGDIDWEEAEKYKEIDAKRLDVTAQQQASGAPVPVLLPDDDELLASAHITVGDGWYAASMSGADHTVALRGSHRMHQMPGASGKKEGDKRRAEEHTLSRTHGIVTLSFESFGVAYAIDVECERPMENPLCVEDDYVFSLAEEAGVLTGGDR